MSHALAHCHALRLFTLQQLSAFERESEVRSADQGEVLFREGEESDAMLLLLEGGLEVRRASGHLAEVPPLALVGEMGLVLNQPRSATVMALKPSRFLWLSRESFRRLIDSDRDLAYKFFRNLTVQLSEHLKKNNLLLEFYQAMS